MSPSLYIPLLLSLCLAGCSLSTSGSLSEVTPTDSGSKTTGGDGPSTTDEPPDSGNAAEDAAQDAGPVADSAAPPDSAPEDAGPPGCALSGKQALHIDASVRWDAKTLLGIVPVLEAGTGTLSVTVLVDHQRDGNVLEGKLRVCDARMPAFTSSLLGETYATRFDHAVWDAPDMPDVPVRMELECPDPGCSLSVPSVTVLLGVELPDPTSPWPTSRDDLQYPDHDGDGQPGVTLRALGPDEPDGSYSYPPADTWTVQRADRIMLGIRAIASLDGSVDTCDAFSGTAAFALDTHAPACRRSRNRGNCTEFESAFVDDNLPHWTAESSTFQARWLAEDAGCADAREAFASP